MGTFKNTKFSKENPTDELKECFMDSTNIDYIRTNVSSYHIKIVYMNSNSRSLGYTFIASNRFIYMLRAAGVRDWERYRQSRGNKFVGVFTLVKVIASKYKYQLITDCLH